MKIEQHSVKSDGAHIMCYLYSPDESTSKKVHIILIMPGGIGFRSFDIADKTPHFRWFADLTSGFCENEYAVLGFEGCDQGKSESGSKWSYSNMEEDLKVVIAYLKNIDYVDKERISILARGYAVAARYFINNPKQIKSLILWACPPRADVYWKKEDRDKWTQRLKNYDVTPADEINAAIYNLVDLAKNIGIPTLISCGIKDDSLISPLFVPAEFFDIIRKIKYPKIQFIIIPCCGREVTVNSPVWENYFNLFLSWFKKAL